MQRRTKVRLLFYVTERLTMFESIRKHTKIAMFLLFLLIIPSFVLVRNKLFTEKARLWPRWAEKRSRKWIGTTHTAATDRMPARPQR
jgi:peptidyl-prolyl cis-trans isomerase D